MRKATKVLLLVSEIFCWVSIGVLVTVGAVYLLLGLNLDLLVEFVQSSGENIARTEIEQVLAPTFITIGAVFVIMGLICIATGILTHSIRKAYAAGGCKSEFRTKAIFLIVLGALSCELCIVPAIFLLVQNEEGFQE